MTDITERLRWHATDWDGRQMPDLEPAKGDPTAGTLREAADEIERLRAALDQAQFRMQLMVDRMPPDEDGKSIKALCQSYVDDIRTALRGQG